MSPTPLDDLGHPVPLGAGPPRRIVSLVPNLTETLWWWHLGDHVVGATEYCVAPPHGFPNAVRVRGTKNPDTAAIIDLAPDLVVANQEENRELDVERLREAGLSVYVTAPRSVEQAAQSLADLAEALGIGGAGAGLAQEIRRAVARGRRGPCPPAGLRARSRETPGWPWGTDTFASDLLRLAGFAVVPDQPRYPEVDLDAVARRGRRAAARRALCLHRRGPGRPRRLVGPRAPRRRHRADVVGAADTRRRWPTCAGWPATSGSPSPRGTLRRPPRHATPDRPPVP